MFNDNAVAGEAAGYAMGLVMLGTGSVKALEEMLQYAHETQHEKIIRGLAIGISFLVYGLQEKADTIIETLTKDKVSLNCWIAARLLIRWLSRIPSCAMAVFTQSPLPMPVLVTTKPFVDYCTSPFLM